MRRIINNIKHHINWFSYYTSKLKSYQSGFVFKYYSGKEVEVPQRMMHTYKECFFDETYFKGMPRNLIATPINTIVDIGANVGYFSLFMLNNFPKASVYSYEPIPMNFALLSKYAQLNKHFDWHAFNCAVTKPGVEAITLNYDKKDSFSTSASVFADTSNQDSIQVQAKSLATIIEDNNLSQIDFLKIDCEGAEYEILYNASEEVFSKTRLIAIETHTGKAPNETNKALADYLENKGYNIKAENDKVWAWK